MTTQFSSQIIQTLLAEARSAHPLECCGILLGTDDVIAEAVRAKNVHPNPETHFEIDPQTLINAHRSARNGGLAILGYYHSHPRGQAEPSETDKAMAHGDGAIWAIIGAGEVKLWQDGDDGFVALPYRIVDR